MSYFFCFYLLYFMYVSVNCIWFVSIYNIWFLFLFVIFYLFLFVICCLYFIYYILYFYFHCSYCVLMHLRNLFVMDTGFRFLRNVTKLASLARSSLWRRFLSRLCISRHFRRFCSLFAGHSLRTYRLYGRCNRRRDRMRAVYVRSALKNETQVSIHTHTNMKHIQAQISARLYLWK